MRDIAVEKGCLNLIPEYETTRHFVILKLLHVGKTEIHRNMANNSNICGLSVRKRSISQKGRFNLRTSSALQAALGGRIRK